MIGLNSVIYNCDFLFLMMLLLIILLYIICHYSNTMMQINEFSKMLVIFTTTEQSEFMPQSLFNVSIL